MCKKLFLSDSREGIFVDLNDILVFSTTGDRKIAMRYLQDGHLKEFEFKSTLSQLKELLPAGEFVQVHKGFLVSAYHIRKIERDFITLDDSRVSRIPIGRVYNCFREQLEQGHVEVISFEG